MFIALERKYLKSKNTSQRTITQAKISQINPNFFLDLKFINMKMHNKNCLIILGLLLVINRNQNYDRRKEWQNDKDGKK